MRGLPVNTCPRCSGHYNPARSLNPELPKYHHPKHTAASLPFSFVVSLSNHPSHLLTVIPNPLPLAIPPFFLCHPEPSSPCHSERSEESKIPIHHQPQSPTQPSTAIPPIFPFAANLPSPVRSEPIFSFVVSLSNHPHHPKPPSFLRKNVTPAKAGAGIQSIETKLKYKHRHHSIPKIPTVQLTNTHHAPNS